MPSFQPREATFSKVMSAYSTEVPEPVPVRQQSVVVRLPPRHIVRRRPQPLERVEVLRNGRSREAVMIGSDGRAIDPGSAALELEPEANARIADLGNDSSGPGTYPVQPVAPDYGMSADGAGMNSGGNK